MPTTSAEERCIGHRHGKLICSYVTDCFYSLREVDGLGDTVNILVEVKCLWSARNSFKYIVGLW